MRDTIEKCLVRFVTHEFLVLYCVSVCRVTNHLQNQHFWRVNDSQSKVRSTLRLSQKLWHLLCVCLCVPASSLTDSSVNSVSEGDTFSLSFTSNICFSVWVSFCEIYNDNIHDLLEQVTYFLLVTYIAVLAEGSILSICNISSNISWIAIQLWLINLGSQWTPQTHSVAPVSGCQRKLFHQR